MSIITKIKNSIESATGLAFYYDTPQTLNTILDKLYTRDYPCAMLHIVQQGAITDANGVLHERLTIEVLFALPCDLDFDGVTVEEQKLDGMKLKAFQWLLALGRNRDLRLISLNNTGRYYATDDVIYCAYGVNVTLEEITGVSKCDYL